MKALSITSGKGGVGKTNISVNLALALSDAGQRVLLLDADMSLANVDVVLGIDARHSLLSLLEREASLDEVLVPVNDHLDLLPSSSGILKLERLSHDERAAIGQQLDSLSDRYDWLLIDTGAGLTPNVLFFNDLADGVLLVTVPEPTALTDTYAMMKVLVRNRRVGPMAVLINQAASAAAASAVHERLSEVSTKFLGVDIPMLGHVPTDANLVKAVKARQPLLRFSPDALASRAIRLLAHKLPEAYPTADRRTDGGFWRSWAAGNERRRAGGT